MDDNRWPDMGKLKKDFGGRAYQWAWLDDWASITLREGRWQILTHHPYDLQEYHYAISLDGERWTLCRVEGREPQRVAEATGDPHEVVAKLRELDEKLEPRIDMK